MKMRTTTKRGKERVLGSPSGGPLRQTVVRPTGACLYADFSRLMRSGSPFAWGPTAIGVRLGTPILGLFWSLIMASFWALIALPERLLTIFQTLVRGLLLSLAFVGLTGAAMAAPPARPQPLTSPDQVPEGLAKSDWASIRAAYEAGRHAFQPTPTGWQARNPGQQWTTTFDRRGFVATPKAGGWTWGLELQGYGFGARQQTIAGTPAVQAEGSRLTYEWDAAVQEWFINDQRGLEHGFTVSARPAADPAALTAPAPSRLHSVSCLRCGARCARTSPRMRLASSFVMPPAPRYSTMPA